MSYQYVNGLDLFGDPFSHNSYSQATQPRTTATQQKTQIQQSRTQIPATYSEPVKAQLQQPQSTTNSTKTQAQTPVLQQNSSTSAPQPAPELKSVISVSTEKTTPVDTKPEPPKKELVMDMSSDTSNKSAIDDTAKRKAHEESEAKRKSEWEAKQRAKKQAEEAAIQKLQDMNPDDLTAAAIKRVSTDVEKITRRSMKQSVSEHIQELARKDVAFARRTMHPRKNMINCFKYINRMAKDYIQQEMEDNDIKPDNGIYGTDVPDGLCYQWAEDYFNAMDVPEDQEKEEKFVPKPYTGTVSSKTSAKTKKAASKAKKAEKPATKETTKKPEPKSSDYKQMSLF